MMAAVLPLHSACAATWPNAVPAASRPGCSLALSVVTAVHWLRERSLAALALPGGSHSGHTVQPCTLSGTPVSLSWCLLMQWR